MEKTYKTLSFLMPLDEGLKYARRLFTGVSDEGYVILDSYPGQFPGMWCVTLKMCNTDATAFSLKYQVIKDRDNLYGV